MTEVTITAAETKLLEAPLKLKKKNEVIAGN